jgi:aconitate hydratase
MIRATIERDGQMQSLKDIGANVLANACGPCIGQWSRPELKKGEPDTIITSYNRNFPGRNDGRRETMNFIGSPELVIALALGGRLSFSPLTDELTAKDGTRFKLNPPKIAPEIPKNGFEDVKDIYVPPADDPDSVKVSINKNSDRLQKLEPFPKWDDKDFEKLPILAKVSGKCTTDQISPAGPWLMYTPSPPKPLLIEEKTISTIPFLPASFSCFHPAYPFLISPESRYVRFAICFKNDKIVLVTTIFISLSVRNFT